MPREPEDLADTEEVTSSNLVPPTSSPQVTGLLCPPAGKADDCSDSHPRSSALASGRGSALAVFVWRSVREDGETKTSCRAAAWSCPRQPCDSAGRGERGRRHRTDIAVLDPVPGHPRQRPRKQLITVSTCTSVPLAFTPYRVIVAGTLVSTSLR